MSSIGIRNKKSIVLALHACALAATGLLVHTLPAPGLWQLAGRGLWWLYLASTVGLLVLPERVYYHPRFNAVMVAAEAGFLVSLLLAYRGEGWVFFPLFLLVIVMAALARRLSFALVLGGGAALALVVLQPDAEAALDDGGLLVLRIVLMLTAAGIVGYLTEELSDQQETSQLLDSALQITTLVSGSLEAKAVYQRLTDVLARLFHAGRVAVIHVQPGAGVGTVIAAIDRGEPLENLEIPLEHYPEIRAAISRREPVVVGNASRHPSLARIDNSRLRNSSILVTPIIVEDEPHGVIFVRLEDWARGFTPQQVAFCRLMADATAHALAQAERFARIEDLANRDGLTGLHNMRSFHRRLDFELGRADANNSTLALLMIDLDFLKRVNDSYGHLAGDEVLRHVAKSLRREVRDTDYCARYGGEEFAVLLTDTEAERAERIADRIRVRVDRDSRDRLPDPVTVSIGIAMYPTDANQPRDLLHHADQALYYSKYRGRNRVTLYSSLESEIGAEDFDATLLEAFTSVAVERHFNHEDPRIAAIRENLTAFGERGAVEDLDDIIQSLTAAMRARDPQTGEHLEKVAAIADLFLSRFSLEPNERRRIRAACILHDIGKLGIGEEILQKPDFLTREEYEVVRRHPEIGAGIVAPLQPFGALVPYIRHHHERWDGQGYPEGLRGEEIPLGARIVGLIDAFHAMISDRPYHNRSRDLTYACAEIRRHAGTQFDPDLATAFLEMVREKGREVDAIVDTIAAAGTPDSETDPQPAEPETVDVRPIEPRHRVLDLPTIRPGSRRKDSSAR